MADNVAITAGSGTTIATDDISNVHFQRVKLVDGTLDSTAVIAGTAISGLRVQTAPLAILTSKTAQYTSTQTSAVLQAGGTGETLVVTYIQIQAGGTTAGTLQVYFGTGAYSRGTNRAIFDGEFAPSSTLKPGVVMNGRFVSGATGDDVLVTTSAAINPLTITIWYYVA